MQLFQHKMRTSQHAKSVESIMTRSHNNFFSSIPFKKISPPSENITTYLRKFEINRQNLNLAKRILLCQSQHSRNKYNKQWQNVKRFLQVRSNFKKTLHADQPKIFKFQPILGKGKLKVNFQVINIDMPLQFWNKKNLYKFVFLLETHQIQPDQKLIPMPFMSTYQTVFYAPTSAKRKHIVGKIFQVSQLNCYQAGRFHVDFAQTQKQKMTVFSKTGKAIGTIEFLVSNESTLKKFRKHSTKEKENLPSLPHTQDTNSIKVTYFSESDA